jgi:hypothetical protein
MSLKKEYWWMSYVFIIERETSYTPRLESKDSLDLAIPDCAMEVVTGVNTSAA